ncbi:hypothetical protein F750_5872 [Streptomyces sp. PAMC 26508]|nr:hypothetical protein F750_5872 [Streptomyces sp. PAMC 26508]
MVTPHAAPASRARCPLASRPWRGRLSWTQGIPSLDGSSDTATLPVDSQCGTGSDRTFTVG